MYVAFLRDNRYLNGLHHISAAAFAATPSCTTRVQKRN